jgi:GR25 family glycosyltransferase involved in LPS biosynthesis
MKSYCINLDHHTAKWKRVSAHLAEHGFAPERVSGVYGKKLPTNDPRIGLFPQYLIANPQIRSSHEQLNTMGAIGCYLSHVKCWQNIIDHNLESAIVFEDDVKLVDLEGTTEGTTEGTAESTNFLAQLNKYIRELPVGTDLFPFGYSNLRNSCDAEYINELFIKCGLFFGTHAYYITRRGAEILLKNAFPIEIQVDSYMAIMGNQKYINVVFPKSSLAVQNNIEGSDIQDYVCLLCNFNENAYLDKLIILCLIIVILTFIIFYLRKFNLRV